MNSTYEWDAEWFTRTQPEKPLHEDGGDIIEHYHSDKLCDAVLTAARACESNEYGKPTAFRIVLVRDSGNNLEGLTDRMWAYLRPDHTLPEFFEEPAADGTYRSNGVRVPKRVHAEVSRIFSLSR